MTCPTENHNPEMLVGYAAGELDPETSMALERHLSGCSACRSMVAEQTAVWRALDAWEGPPVSSDFNRRLYRRIEAGERLSWWARLTMSFHPIPLRRALPLTATAGLLLMASLLLQHPNRFAPPAPRGEIVRAEQVERTLDDLDLLRQFATANAAESTHSDAM